MAWEWLAPVATGVVGMAGIIGTTVAATLGRRTQLETTRLQASYEALRLERADKRALYAKALGKLTTLIDLGSRVGQIREAAQNDHSLADPDLVETYIAASAEMVRLKDEVGIVAGPDLAAKVHKAAQVAAGAREWSDDDDHEKFQATFKSLTSDLHTDLNSTTSNQLVHRKRFLRRS